MINSPLQNIAAFNLSWFQLRPKVTQPFGANPDYYFEHFKMKGHSGQDLRAAVGTQLFAPIDGKIEVRNYGRKSYGLHIRISNERLLIILAHLRRASVKTGDTVNMGEKIGLTGNSGLSTGPHLHMGGYKLKDGKVQDRMNGYGGAFDLEPHTIAWKGTLNSFNL